MASQSTPVDSGAMKLEMRNTIKGKTSEQKKIIRYFFGVGGCLAKGYTEDEYTRYVNGVLSGSDYKAQALEKLGIDESQAAVSEPVHFEGYCYQGGNVFARQGRDGVWRSSVIQVSWLFFGEDTVYVYRCTYNAVDGSRKEDTLERSYADVNNFSVVPGGIDKNVIDNSSGTWTRRSVDNTRFSIVMRDDSFTCALALDDYAEQSLRRMKSLLRDMKRK